MGAARQAFGQHTGHRGAPARIVRKHARDSGSDGVSGHAELFADLTVGQTIGHEFRDALLGRGECFGAVRGRAHVGKGTRRLLGIERSASGGCRPDDVEQAVAALEGAEFVEHLPRRLNKVLDALAEGRFHIQVDGLDEAELMRGIQKLANRGAAGVVVAALLLAAGLFAGAHTGPLWWGFSAFSTVMLGLAAAVGAWLAMSMRRSDLPQRRRER